MPPIHRPRPLAFTALALALGVLITPSAHGAPEGDEKGEADAKFIPPGPHHEVPLTLTEGTWVSVTVHGDRVVFDLLGDLWSVPITGGDATQLTSGTPWDAQPRFSPDGRQLAFVSDRGGNEVLWIMPAEGGEPRIVVDEEDARITQPVWDPTGPWILGRRRTVDTRSIGVTEVWQYHLEGGEGFALTTLDDHPHAGEMAAFGDDVYFSSRAGRFEYGSNPYQGLWSIQRLNRRTGEVAPVLRGDGSASRPTLSPDGARLAFISRTAKGTLLEMLDLKTGARTLVSDDMAFDELEGFALHGTYPSIAWHGEALVYWAKGKLWRHTPGKARVEIPFKASGTWRFRTVERWTNDATGPAESHLVRHPALSPDGQTLAFSALGAVYTQALGDASAEPERVTEGMGAFPTYSPDGKTLAFATFDGQRGAVVLQRGRKSETIPIAGQPIAPAFGPRGETLALLHTLAPGSRDLVDVGALELLIAKKEKRGWAVTPLCQIEWEGFRAPPLYVTEDRIFFTEHRETEPRHPMDTVLVSVDHQCHDKRDHINLGEATRAVLSPDGRSVAFQRGHIPYLTALPPLGAPIKSTEALPIQRLATMGGAFITFSPKGDELLWLGGPTLERVRLADLPKPAPGEEKKDWEDADHPKLTTRALALNLPTPEAPAPIALVGGRLLTMKGEEIREGEALIIEGGKITAIGGPIPQGATIIDIAGKTVIPGLIDVHAHLHYTAMDTLPAQEWRYLVNLDFGVTTVHDPSASSDVVFTQAERVRAGEMAGPRVFSTGYILYGALDAEGVHATTYAETLAQVARMKAQGAVSVKVYQQSQRDRRQRFVAACHETHTLCVAEGGGDLFMDLSMVADGFHSVEHALPQAPLYGDVRAFLKASHGPEGSLGTAYTPTLLVAYGGLEGEHYFRATQPPSAFPRLGKSYPPRALEADTLRWRQFSLGENWHFMDVARSAAAVARDGGLVTLGAHGQLQGLGVHWELWGLAVEGGMSPMEALRAATIQGARYLGMEDQLGSIEVGKQADLVILNGDPLADIHKSADIHTVIKGGAIVSQ